MRAISVAAAQTLTQVKPQSSITFLYGSISQSSIGNFVGAEI